MIRELIEQIELEKTAELALLSDDPYQYMMKAAFADELEKIALEKDASWVGELAERAAIGTKNLLRRGVKEPAKKVTETVSKPKHDWFAVQPTVQPGTALSRADRAAEAANAASAQARRAWEQAPVIGAKPARHRL